MRGFYEGDWPGWPLGFYRIVIRMALLSLMDIRVVNAVEMGSEGRNTWYKYASGKGKERKRKKHSPRASC
jgi:hypothetical protein